jgi:predicted Zn-dependent peptidase
MKRKILWVCFMMACVCSARAQTTTTSFNVNGIKVIFKPTQKKVVNIRIYFRGGISNYKPEQAGLENMATQAAVSCGTNKYAANALRDTAEKYGVLLSAQSSYDFSYIQLNCISTYFNQGWDLFSETVNQPVFDETELSLLKTKAVNGIRRAASDPNSRLFDLQMKAAFENTPYATDPIGTEQTVGGFSAADLKSYYKTLLNKQKIFIVAVGNLDKQDLYEKILYAFDHIPSVPYMPEAFKVSVNTDSKLVTEQRNLEVAYVGAVMPAPEFTSADYVPFRLAMAGFGGNLYRSLRSQYHLSYDPWQNVVACRIPVAMLGASSNNPKMVMQVMMRELKAVQNGGYSDEWLQHLKNIYIASSYFADQSSAAVTENLGRAEILGNWQYADDLPQLVNMVTVEQVNRVINYYIPGLRWAYLGNLDAIEGFKPPAY